MVFFELSAKKSTSATSKYVHVINTKSVERDETDHEYEGSRVDSGLTEMFDLLCQTCACGALSCPSEVANIHGSVREPFYNKYNIKTVVSVPTFFSERGGVIEPVGGATE